MQGLETYVIVMNTVTLVCGGLITYFAFRAYRRTGSIALGALAVGLACVCVGAFVAGGLHQLTTLNFETGIGIQSTFTALGFVILAYSLYARPTVQNGDAEDPVSG
jgi:glucose uptake protein GlcU